MAIRSLTNLTLAAFLASPILGCGGAPSSQSVPSPRYTPALAQGMARLDLARSEETLLAPSRASVFIAGRPLVTLGTGDRHSVDVPAGNHVITVSHRTGATPSVQHLTAKAGRAYQLQISIDPRRFPPYDGPTRPLKFIGESLDAPTDERQPLFLIRSLGSPTLILPRSSARRSEAELDREMLRSESIQPGRQSE